MRFGSSNQSLERTGAPPCDLDTMDKFDHHQQSVSGVPAPVAQLGRWTEVRVSPLRIRCSSFLPQTHAGQMRIRDAMSASDGRSEMNCVATSETCPRIRYGSAVLPSQPVRFVRCDCDVAERQSERDIAERIGLWRLYCPTSRCTEPPPRAAVSGVSG